MVVFLRRAEALLRPGPLWEFKPNFEPFERRLSLRTESLRCDFLRTEFLRAEKYGGARRARIAPRTPRKETL